MNVLRKWFWLAAPLFLAGLVFGGSSEVLHDLGMIHPIRIDEHLEVDRSYYYNSGVQYYEDRHAVQLSFQYMQPTQSVTTGAVIGEVGLTTTSGSQGTTGTTGSTTSGEGYYLHVATPGEMSAPTAPSYHAAVGSLPASLVHTLQTNAIVSANLSAATVLSGGTLTVTLEYYDEGVPDNPTTPDVNEEVKAVSTFWKTTYTITKIACNDASVDSRKIPWATKRHGPSWRGSQRPGEERQLWQLGLEEKRSVRWTHPVV